MFEFNEYLKLMSNKESSIFDLDSQTSYQHLIEQAWEFSLALKNLKNKKIGLLTQSPLTSMIQMLGAIIAGVEVTLISDKEPAHALEVLQKRYKVEVLISKDYVVEKSETPCQFDHSLNHFGVNVLSSGSTGESKEIYLSVNNLYASVAVFTRYFETKEDEVFLANLPHNHVGGLMVLWRAFFNGASISTNEDLKTDYISLVPLQLKRSLNDPVKVEKLKSKKCILIGGAPFEESLKQEAMALGLKVYETYGMSETASFVMLNQSVLDDIEIKLSPQGLFQIKGAMLSKSAPIDSEGYFTTSDMGEKIAHNKYKFHKRIDIQFKSAGELINPLEIEKALSIDPRIKNAVSTYIPHYKWTNAHTLIIDTDTEDFEELVSFIKEDLKPKLHPYQIPKYYFKATHHLFVEGLKPKRHTVANFANESFLKSLFHYKFIDNQKEKTMVVFHGFMENLSDFNFMIEGISRYNLLLIDLPGHGQTKVNHFSSRSEIYFYLTQLINHFTQRPIIYGYSMGARVAIELVLSSLEVDFLILESASLGLDDQQQKTQRLENDLKLFDNINSKEELRDFLEKWYDNPIFTGHRESPSFNDFLSAKLPHDHKQWQESLGHFSPGASSFLLKDTLLKLKSIKIIAITGVLDTKYDQLFMVHAPSFDNCTHHRISNVGHSPHKVAATQILEIINNT